MNKLKKRVISLLLIISCITVALSGADVEAASVKYVEGLVDAYAQQRMYVKATNTKITVSGYYGIAKSRNKTYNTIRKRPKKTFKVAKNCKVQTGDDVLEIMEYGFYLENEGRNFMGPIVCLKIKNGKVVKVIMAS